MFVNETKNIFINKQEKRAVDNVIENLRSKIMVVRKGFEDTETLSIIKLILKSTTTPSLNGNTKNTQTPSSTTPRSLPTSIGHALFWK